ncbi:MAG: DUF1573 domain-containing protein [Phycisphaerales bacterium]|nr:MAG: DUF1573 domain-containing protein [Phycisphaerales bacterium]
MKTRRDAFLRLFVVGATLCAALAPSAHAQVHATAHDVIDREIRLRPMLEQRPDRQTLDGPFRHVENGVPMNVYLVRPDGQPQRTAREAAVAFGPDQDVAFIALNRVVLALHEPMTRGAATDFLARVGAIGPALHIGGRHDLYLAEVRSAQDAYEISAALRELPIVRYAHPDTWGAVEHSQSRTPRAPAARADDATLGMNGPVVRVQRGPTQIDPGDNFNVGTTTQGIPIATVFSVFNDGDETLLVDVPMITGAGYTISPTAPANVAPGGNTNYTITLSGADQGVFNGTVSILSNATNDNPFIFFLTGEVEAPTGPATIRLTRNGAVLSSGSNVNFGTTFEEDPVDIMFAITNTGADELTIGTVTVPNGYSVQTAPASPLAGGTTTNMIIRLDAVVPGDYDGPLSFLNNSSVNPFTLNLTGTVEMLPDPPMLRVQRGDNVIPNNGSDAFPATDVNVAVQRTYTIFNDGGSPLNITGFRTPTGYTAVAMPAPQVSPGDATSVTIQLDAVCGGLFVGDVRFSTDDPDAENFRFTLTGNVEEPAPSGGVDDPNFLNQWHLRNIGQLGSIPGIDIRAPEAWQLTLGEGVTVAIMDDGMQPDHPDYRDNAEELDNFFNRELNIATNFGAHGTSVTGLIVGTANYCGGRGVAPSATGLFTNNFVQSVAESAQSMYDANDMGAAIHSNSWRRSVFHSLPEVMRDAVEDLSVNGRDGLGMLFIFAAGNEFGPIAWNTQFAAMPETVAVGSMNNLSRRSIYSNFGPQLDFVAPSNDLTPNTFGIFTTDVTGVAGYNRVPSSAGGDFTSTFGGTSAATPIASGVAALILGVNPDLHATQVRRIMRHTAREIGIINNDRGYQRLTGFSDSFGYGLIDAGAAVLAASQSITNGGRTWPASPEGLAIANRDSGGVELEWTNPPTNATGEYHRVLLVRHSASTIWRPTDGVDYSGDVGQLVTTGTRILAVDDIDTYTDPDVGLTTNATYAVYTVNPANRYSIPRVIRAAPIEPILIFADDFESDLGWQYEGDWERGAPVLDTADRKELIGGEKITVTNAPMPPTIHGFNAPFVGTNVVATDLAGDYSPGVEHILNSPVIDLTNPALTSASLSFHELLDHQGGGFDIARLQVIDVIEGEVIRTLLTNNQNITYTWREQWHDLRGQLGRTIQLRWTLVADDKYQFSGWHIDAVRVGGSTGGTGPIPPRRPPIVLPGFDIFGPFIPGGIPGSGPLFMQSPNDNANPDLNGDGAVTIEDLVIMLDHFGETRTDPRYNAEADLTGDGRIGVADVVLMLSVIAAERPS